MAGHATVLADGIVAEWASADGRHVLAGRASGASGIPILRPFLHDLWTNDLWELTTHGEVTLMAWDRYRVIPDVTAQAGYRVAVTPLKSWSGAPPRW